jgi:hypothetical protein
LIGGMAEHGYLSRSVPHKVITGREPADCEPQYLDGRAHLAGSAAVHQAASVLQVSNGLIVISALELQTCASFDSV